MHKKQTVVPSEKAGPCPLCYHYNRLSSSSVTPLLSSILRVGDFPGLKNRPAVPLVVSGGGANESQAHQVLESLLLPLVMFGFGGPVEEHGHVLGSLCQGGGGSYCCWMKRVRYRNDNGTLSVTYTDITSLRNATPDFTANVTNSNMPCGCPYRCSNGPHERYASLPPKKTYNKIGLLIPYFSLSSP